MSEPEHQSEQAFSAEAKTELGASLQADYAALKNDLDQAKELAADFQRELAGKSNEVAHFKVLLERTQTDFKRLEGHIDELRRERHRLANEAMRAMALEVELKKKTQEIERLREQLTTLGAAGGQRVEELLVVSEDQQREIKRLRAIVDVFRRKDVPAAAGGIEAQQQIDELKATVKRLQDRLAQSAFAGSSPEPSVPEMDADVINLTFER